MSLHAASRDPIKAAESERIAREVAEWEAKNGKIQTMPLKALSDDGRTVVKGRVQMTIAKQGWKEGGL